MIDQSTNAVSVIKKNDRYFLALLAAFVLGLLLLFYKDLQPWMQKLFVPSYVVYIIGTALIAQIQQMVGTREELRCKSSERDFTGSPRWFFRCVIVIHILWFALWVTYLLLNTTCL